MLLKFLSVDLFSNCHVEAYSFWVKKRVLVFEYGINGKIKLGVEPHEQGALIDFTVGTCAFKDRCPSTVDALMYYYRPELPRPVLSIIFAKKDFLNSVKISDIQQIVRCFSTINQDLTIKFIIATNSPKEQVEQLFKQLTFEVYTGSYSDYIGREVEDFIKN